MKFLRILIIFFFSLFFIEKNYAQIDSTELIGIYSKKLAFNEDFSRAIVMYKNLLAMYPESPTMNFKLGYSYLNTQGKADSAILFLKKASELYSQKYKSEVNPVEIKFYLARAYSLNKEYDSSLMILEKMRLNSHNPFLIKILSDEIENVKKNYKGLKKVYSLDSVINTSFTEHSPIYVPDLKMLIYTSRRPHTNGTVMDDGQYDEDVLYSMWQNNRWTNPKPIEQINTEFNDATSALISGSHTLLLYKDVRNGDIYETKFINGKWTEPSPLPYPINTRFRETSASITKDGKQIFFSSNRKGGIGGMDIWTSTLLDNGKWSKPKNMGDAINTKGDEDGVYISPDGNTLYFSSNGRGGFGGFDIFVCNKNEFGTWTKPRNLGYPINSAGDDVFFTPDEDSTTAYFTSYRYGSKGADIFVVLLEDKSNNRPIINYGFIVDQTDRPLSKDIKIEIRDLTDSLLAISHPNNSGKFIFLTYPFKKYKIRVLKDSQLCYQDTLIGEQSEDEIKFYKKIKIKYQQ